MTTEEFKQKFPDVKKFSNIEIDGIDRKDHPDYSDAFFSYAMYEDHELDDGELDLMSDIHVDLINEMIFDKQLYL